jgi:hypothetical protein
MPTILPDAIIPNLPERQFFSMKAQPLVPWTPALALRAAWALLGAGGRKAAKISTS